VDAPPQQTSGLTRRTPKAAEPVPVAAPAGPARQRTAAEVRGMLAGFRSGVERGRTAPAPTEPAPTEPAPTAPPVEADAEPTESNDADGREATP
jgi:hypothetical protein